MENMDLGEGRKILSAPVAIGGYVLDPTGEDSLQKARDACCRVCGCRQEVKADEKDSSARNGWGLILLFGLLALGLLKFASERSALTCVNCGTVADFAGSHEPSFRCPVCGTRYAR